MNYTRKKRHCLLINISLDWKVLIASLRFCALKNFLSDTFSKTFQVKIGFRRQKAPKKKFYRNSAWKRTEGSRPKNFDRKLFGQKFDIIQFIIIQSTKEKRSTKELLIIHL